MNEFANEPVDVASLPRLANDAFVRVHRNHLRVALIGFALAALVAVVAGIVLSAIVRTVQWIPLVVAAGAVAMLGLGAIAKVLEVRHIAYQVRDHDISYRNGVLFRTVSTVPFVRVQHAKLRQGPVQRLFGLATVEVNSAGPDLQIKGVGFDDAEQLKALVLERAGDLVEE